MPAIVTAASFGKQSVSLRLSLPRFGGQLTVWPAVRGHFVLLSYPILLFGPRRSHSSVPARRRDQPARAAIVKDGLWPPEGLVLDGGEHAGRLMRVGVDRTPLLVVERREIAEGGDARASMSTKVALRTSSGSRRKSSPLSSMRSKPHMNTLSSASQRRIISKQAIPSAPHATASPSMMQERERSRASVSTMSGKRFVR
jgi:hypothetical protein